MGYCKQNYDVQQVSNWYPADKFHHKHKILRQIIFVFFILHKVNFDFVERVQSQSDTVCPTKKWLSVDYCYDGSSLELRQIDDSGTIDTKCGVFEVMLTDNDKCYAYSDAVDDYIKQILQSQNDLTSKNVRELVYKKFGFSDAQKKDMEFFYKAQTSIDTLKVTNDCTYTEWESSWKCLNGLEMYQRKIQNPAQNGGECPGPFDKSDVSDNCGIFSDEMKNYIQNFLKDSKENLTSYIVQSAVFKQFLITDKQKSDENFRFNLQQYIEEQLQLPMDCAYSEWSNLEGCLKVASKDPSRKYDYKKLKTRHIVTLSRGNGKSCDASLMDIVDDTECTKLDEIGVQEILIKNRRNYLTKNILGMMFLGAMVIQLVMTIILFAQRC